jgi:hypothetical protein
VGSKYDGRSCVTAVKADFFTAYFDGLCAGNGQGRRIIELDSLLLTCTCTFQGAGGGGLNRDFTKLVD